MSDARGAERGESAGKRFGMLGSWGHNICNGRIRFRSKARPGGEWRSSTWSAVQSGTEESAARVGEHTGTRGGGGEMGRAGAVLETTRPAGRRGRVGSGPGGD